MIEKKSLERIKKWNILILTAFLFLILQSTEIFSFFINETIYMKLTLVFPFAICCSLFLKKEEAAIFAFICGLFLDCYNGVIFGFSSIVLLFFCTIISIIFKRYIRICLFSVISLNIILFSIYCFLIFVFKYIVSETQNPFSIWLFGFIPNIIYTTFISVFIFLLSKKICYNKKIHIKQAKRKFIKERKTKNGK